MKAKVICYTLLALAAVTALPAQNQVSAPEKRAQILEKVALVLAEDSIELPNLDVGRSSPFSAVDTRVVQPERVATTVPTAVVVTRLSDADALAAIASQFRPTGAMVTESRQMLRMSDGSSMNEGRVIRAKIRGQVYSVVIEKITIDGYTLKLDSARLERTFLDNE